MGSIAWRSVTRIRSLASSSISQRSVAHSSWTACSRYNPGSRSCKGVRRASTSPGTKNELECKFVLDMIKSCTDEDASVLLNIVLRKPSANVSRSFVQAAKEKVSDRTARRARMFPPTLVGNAHSLQEIGRDAKNMRVHHPSGCRFAYGSGEEESSPWATGRI